MKWLFNFNWLRTKHLPNITASTSERTCDYCGAEHNWWHYHSNGLTICHDCMKKAFDSILKETQ